MTATDITVKAGREPPRPFRYSVDTERLCTNLTSSRYQRSKAEFFDQERQIRIGASSKPMYAQGPKGLSVVDMYLAAAIAKPYLQRTLDIVATRRAESMPEVARLKGLWRIAEKAMSRTDEFAGEVMFVNDVCRSQVCKEPNGSLRASNVKVAIIFYDSVLLCCSSKVVFASIDRLHNALARLALDERVVVVRVKDRFSHPAPGGWSDIMVNLFHTDDPNRHICEIQFCLWQMLRLRQVCHVHTCRNLTPAFGTRCAFWQALSSVLIACCSGLRLCGLVCL